MINKLKELIRNNKFLYSNIVNLINFYNKLKFRIINGKYNGKEYWDNRGLNFVNEGYQNGIYPQHYWILENINKHKPKKILEIGCGFGRNIKFIKDNIDFDIEIKGIDISENLISGAKKFLKSYNGISLETSDILNLSEDEEYDMILIHGVFMHIDSANIRKNLEKVLCLKAKKILLAEEIKYKNHVLKSVNINGFTFGHNYFYLLEKYIYYKINFSKIDKDGSYVWIELSENFNYYNKILQDELNYWNKHSSNETMIYDKNNLEFNLIFNKVANFFSNNIKDNSKILELGSNNGSFSKEVTFGKKGIILEGVDIINTKQNDINNKVLNFDLNFFNFSENTYDTIIIKGCMHHLINVDLIVYKLNKSLAKGGILLLQEPYNVGLFTSLFHSLMLLVLPTKTSYMKKFKILFSNILNIGTMSKNLTLGKGIYGEGSPFENVTLGNEILRSVKNEFKIDELVFQNSFMVSYLSQSSIKNMKLLKVINVFDLIFVKLGFIKGYLFMIKTNKKK